MFDRSKQVQNIKGFRVVSIICLDVSMLLGIYMYINTYIYTYLYAPIPSGSGFGVGFGYLNTGPNTVFGALGIYPYIYVDYTKSTQRSGPLGAL